LNREETHKTHNMPPTTTITLFLWCLVFSFPLLHALPSILPSVSTFVVPANVQESISVSMVNSDGITVGCKLDYDTSTLSGEESKKFEPVEKLISQITKKYGCLTRSMSIFTYTVCLGDKVEQTADNGDTYSLGKYTASEGSKSLQQYNDGTFCEAAHSARKSVVEFACAESKARIVSIEESAVCQYRITVGAPEVCGHPGFSVVSKVESWLLEISETDTGEMICQAYNNGFDVIGNVQFSKFSLACTGGATDDLAKVVIRRKNRQPVARDALRIDGARVATQERMQIEYAKIVAE